MLCFITNTGGKMTYSLYLAHINDTHSHFEATPLTIKLPLTLSQERTITVECGGYPMIASALKQQRNTARQQGIPHLFLHAGDSFQGSLYFSCFKGAANANLLNQLMPDAMTIGNHEFDLGNTPLSKFIKNARFPLLAGNMDLSKEDPTKPYPLAAHSNLHYYDKKQDIAQYILKPLGDKQLAIVGITLDMMEKIGCPDHDCHFLNAIDITRKTITYLNNVGINHIIILSHLGYQGDVELAQAVPGISMIVGGHSHTITADFSDIGLESTQQSQHWIGDTLVVQAGKHAETIGLSYIEFNEHGKVVLQEGGIKLLVPNDCLKTPHNSWLSNSDITQCLKYLQASKLCELHPPCDTLLNVISSSYRPAIDKMRSNIVTTLSQDYLHVRVPNEALPNGSQIAPFVAESFFHCATKHIKTDFALHNAGGVRVSLNQGKLTQADICGRLLPFEIQLVSYQVSGHDLKQALEGAINNATNNSVIGTGDGSYPYCFNLKFVYQATNELGCRIKSLQVKRNNLWCEVVDDVMYSGVSSAYTIAGKEGYDALLNSTNLCDLPYSMSDAFIIFLKGNNMSRLRA